MAETLKKILRDRRVLLFLLLFTVYNLNLRSLWTSDCIPATFLPLSIIGEFNLNLDEFTFLFEKDSLPYYLSFNNNHLYSNYSVFTSILATPVYLVPVLAGFVKNVYDVFFLGKLAASAMTALAGVFFYMTLMRMKVDQKSSVFLTLCYSLATSLWTICGQALWSHTSGHLGLAAALFCVVSARKNTRYLVPCGIFCALAAVSRINNSIMVLAISVYVLTEYRKHAVMFLLAPLIIAVLYFSLNLIQFNTLLGGTGEYVRLLEVRQGLPGGGSRNFMGAVAGILISPSRGLFIFSPWLLFCFAGIVQVWKKRKDRLFMYVSIGIILTILFFGRVSAWWGGLCYGPRKLVDILPFLCVYGFFVMDGVRKNKLLKITALVMLIYSFGIQIVGAFFYNGDWYHNPVSVDQDHKRLWDWKDNVIVRSIKNGLQEVQFNYPFTKYPAQNDIDGLYDRPIPAAEKEKLIKTWDYNSHYNLAAGYEKTGMYEKAIRQYREVIKIEPGNAEAHFRLAVVYEKAGRDKEALTSYSEAINRKQDYVEAYNNLGTVYGRLGMNEKAVDMFRKATRVNPQYFDAHYNLAMRYSGSDWNAMISELKKALELKPDYRELNYNLGIAYDRTGQKEKAIKAYKREMEVNPGYASAYKNAGILCHALGDSGKAAGYWRKYLELNPGAGDAELIRKEINKLENR